jgi:UDP-glucose 4-epimerase
MNILVTGGAGFIGSHLVDKLAIFEEQNVIVLDDLSAGKLENLKLSKGRITINLGSVYDYKLVDTIAREYKIDLIYHLATPCLVKGIEDPKLMHDVTDAGTFNVCLAAKNNNCKIIYISTSEVYGNLNRFPISEKSSTEPVSIYGLTKLIGEKYVSFFHRIFGVPALIIRPFNTYGERHREDDYACVVTNFVKRAREGKMPIINGDGRQRRDFTYVKDVVTGIRLLSHLSDGQIIVIGSGTDISMKELANLVWKIYYKKEVIPSYIFEKSRPNDVYRLQADITLARTYGYDPKISLEDGLNRYIELMCPNRII